MTVGTSLSDSFYRAAWNADAVHSEDNSVSLSVWLSVKRVDCDKTEEISDQIFIMDTKEHLA